MGTEGTKYKHKQFLFTGEWIPDEDPLKIGEKNFADIQNLRYGKVGLQGILGYSKINTTALTTYLKGRSGIQLKSPYSGQNRVLVQAQNSGGTGAAVLENKTAVPSQGDFEAAVVHTDDSEAGLGRFSKFPAGNIAYGNGKEMMIYAGNEMKAAGLINYDPADSFKYDYSEVIGNTEDDAKNIATLHRVSESVDSDTMLLLHLDNNATDSSPTTPHTVTGYGGYTYDASVKVFGTHSVKLNGTGYLRTNDDADFDFSGGVFTVDARIRVDTSLPGAGHTYPIYNQATDANNYFLFCIDENGALKVSIYSGGAEVFSLVTANGKISVDTFYHIELCESGDDWRIFINGVQEAYASDATRAANYTGYVFIGTNAYISDCAKVYIDEYRVSNCARHSAAFEVPSAAYGSATYMTYLYLGSTRPLTAIKPYVKDVNTNAGTLTVYYWDGLQWVSVSSLSDGTASGGVPLAQTGTISFDSTVDDAKVKVIDSIALYWYRIIITDADDTTTLSHVSVDAPFQGLKDIWDGALRTPIAFVKYDNSIYEKYTLNVTEEDYVEGNSATYADVSGLLTTEYLYIGFDERIMGIIFKFVPNKVHTTINTYMTVERWEGDEWVSVGKIIDGTMEGNRAFANSGLVTFNPADDNVEFRTQIDTSMTPLYFYRISFSKTLSTTVYIDHICGIPAPRNISGEYAFPFMFQNRAMLCGYLAGKEGNRVDYSMMYAPDVYNGEDSSGGSPGPLYFGSQESDLICACQIYNRFGSNIYNTAVFCKAVETYLLNGYDADTWSIYQISEKIGCPAPLTMDTAEVSYGVAEDAVRNIALWLSYNGPVLFDGAVIVPIRDRIKCYFDKHDDRCINFDAIENSRGWVDPDNMVYNLGIPSGTSQTEINVWLEFDLIRKRWTKKVPKGTSAYVQGAFRVSDDYGTQYVYGMRDNGYMMRLEHGNTWDGEDIDAFVKTADMVPTGDMWDFTSIRFFKLLAEKISEAVSVAIEHYADGKSSATSLASVAVNSGDRWVKDTQSLKLHAWSHQFKFSMSTGATALGVPLLAWGYQYEVLREDRR